LKAELPPTYGQQGADIGAAMGADIIGAETVTPAQGSQHCTGWQQGAAA
jgi:hypothetical protein